MSCGVGHRHSSDLVLLWHRLAAAALIRPLVWELLYATEEALKNKNKQTNKQTKCICKTIPVYTYKDILNEIFYCAKIHLKFTILTCRLNILSIFTSLYNHHHHHLWNVFFPNWKLCTHLILASHSRLPLALGNHSSTLCSSEFDSSRYPM